MPGWNFVFVDPGKNVWPKKTSRAKSPRTYIITYGTYVLVNNKVSCLLLNLLLVLIW